MEKISINGFDTFEIIMDGVRYRQMPEWTNYWVGENGRVYNMKMKWMLGEVLSSHGYTQVFFHQDQKISTGQKTHRWVAKLFLPNPENKREVNHIDGVKKNADISNLEWVTPSENMYHAFRTGLNKHSDYQKSESARRGRLLYGGGGNPKARKVINIKTNEIFGCSIEAADSIGMKKGTLRAQLLGHNSNRTDFRYLDTITNNSEVDKIPPHQI